MIVWDIYETRSNTFDVTKSRKAFAYDLETQEEAIKKIKKSRFYNQVQPVVLHTNDGLRRNLKL